MGVSKWSWEIWKLEVGYERFTEATLTHKYAMIVARVVYGFVSSFPEKHRAKDFDVCDVQDWAVRRGREVCQESLSKELYILHGFFRWIQSKGVDCSANPVVVLRLRHRLLDAQWLGLDQLQALQASAAGNAIDAKILELALTGKGRVEIGAAVGREPTVVSERFRKLRHRAGLPSMTFAHFYKAYQKLCFRLGERSLGMSASSETDDLQTPAHTLSTEEPSLNPQTHLLVN